MHSLPVHQIEARLDGNRAMCRRIFVVTRQPRRCFRWVLNQRLTTQLFYFQFLNL